MITKIYYFLSGVDIPKKAYAQFLTHDILTSYHVDKKYFHCPFDDNGGASYGINSNLSKGGFNQNSLNTIIIADCDSYTFNGPNQIAKRHKNNHALAIAKNGEIAIIHDGDNYEYGEKYESGDDEDDDCITICHKPGKPAEKTLCVPESALNGHLGHGDYTGQCVGP